MPTAKFSLIKRRKSGPFLVVLLAHRPWRMYGGEQTDSDSHQSDYDRYFYTPQPQAYSDSDRSGGIEFDSAEHHRNREYDEHYEETITFDDHHTQQQSSMVKDFFILAMPQLSNFCDDIIGWPTGCWLGHSWYCPWGEVRWCSNEALASELIKGIL